MDKLQRTEYLMTLRDAAHSAGKPLLLDIACGAGGASMGYSRAGFQIVGVDIARQPRYPFEFVRADMLNFISHMGWLFDAVHASPPCQDHSPLRSRAGTNGTGWLLGATRVELVRLGKPWVIENVPGSPMRKDLILCGEMFGLRTVRHRWFESSVELTGSTTCRGQHKRPTSTSKRMVCLNAGYNISITGDVGSYVGVPCMGIDWMNGNELSQAIPPAYTEYVGQQLMATCGERIGYAGEPAPTD